MSESRPWHAVYTRHQHEKVVVKILVNKSFETFLPLYETTRVWKDRTKQLWLPLFPCYVFIQGGLDRWLDVVSTPGVYAVVASGARPAVIPQAEIDAVRRAVEAETCLEPHPFLRRGDLVRVKSGALEGIEGMLVRKKNRFRLVLSVNLLEKSIAFEVDAVTVERVRRGSAGSASKWVEGRAPQRAWA